MAPAGGGFPVNHAQIIAQGIFSQFREFGTAQGMTATPQTTRSF
jgi:hypothetical protein